MIFQWDQRLRPPQAIGKYIPTSIAGRHVLCHNDDTDFNKIKRHYHKAFDLMSWVFTNGPGDQDSIILKTKKMVLYTALLNTKH